MLRRYYTYIALIIIFSSVSPGKAQDTIPNNIMLRFKIFDTIQFQPAMMNGQFDQYSLDLARFKKEFISIDSSFYSCTKPLYDQKSKINIRTVYKELRQKPFFSLSNGIVNYSFTYRSRIDTPTTEKNITQYQIFTSFGITLANLIPLRINAYIRKSNSNLFKDITDLQIQYDAATYKNLLNERIKSELLRYSSTLKDSLTKTLYDLKNRQLHNISQWLNNSLVSQKLIEANEILIVESIAFENTLSDSLNTLKTDSLRVLAKAFISNYTEMKEKYERVSYQVDSLKDVYQRSVQRMQNLNQIIKAHRFYNIGEYKNFKTKVEKFGFSKLENLSQYRWLLGLRSLGLGRSNINTSELTAKNISLTGIRFEYSSWYYLMIAAGNIDYRYRDFVVNRLNKLQQILYLVRAGIGNPDRNIFILSAFHGNRQVFAVAPSPSKTVSIKVSGIGVEGKWHFRNNSYLKTEVAQSFSPNLQVLRRQEKCRWRLSDKSNKGVFLKAYYFFPETSSQLEGSYKFTGANYQSFNSFQSNAAVESWRIKAEQNLFKRKLKIMAAISSNDFSNPFIRQNYKSNTIFKSVGTRINIKEWPVVGFAYTPQSQFTMVDGYLSESRFQTLQGSISHHYKIGEARASTNMVYTKFFNTGSDTGFIFFNSTNFFAAQAFLFQDFTINLNISTSVNLGYTYTVMDESVSFPFSEKVNIGVGVKVNRLNKEAIRLGGLFHGSVTLFQKDVLSFQLERSYLPGNDFRLIPNIFGNINYAKNFR